MVRALPRRARWPDDREAVRLVADLLDEMQARMRRRELQRARLRFEDQLFLSGLALGPFGHADHADLVQAQIMQDCSSDAHLPLAAVDQDQVRDLACLGGHALVAPRQHLLHGGVVVARRDVADVEAPVFGFLHLLRS